MTSEPYKFRLIRPGDFDGTTEMTQTRDAFTVTGQRHYELNITEPAGIVRGDFFGVFQDTAPKLVGVSSATANPQSAARVLATGTQMPFRQQISLTPQMQYVAMYPGDRLALLTHDGLAEVNLVVNELTESDHVRFALQHGPAEQARRLRILRPAGVAFVANPKTEWHPTFAYDVQGGRLIAVDDGTGAIPVSKLSFYPRSEGCFLSVRYAGSDGHGALHIVEHATRKARLVQANLPDVEWSRVQFVDPDDLIAFEAAPAVPGDRLLVDIELVRARPGERLRARYAAST